MTLEGYQFLVIRNRVSKQQLHTLQRTAILQTDLSHIAASSARESESSQRFGCSRSSKAGVHLLRTHECVRFSSVWDAICSLGLRCFAAVLSHSLDPCFVNKLWLVGSARRSEPFFGFSTTPIVLHSFLWMTYLDRALLYSVGALTWFPLPSGTTT